LLRCDPPNVSSSEDAFNRALEIARSQQTKTFELRSALGLARLCRSNGRAGVSELLAPVLVDFDRGQDLPEVQEAEKLLNLSTMPASYSLEGFGRSQTNSPRAS
jgi:hypothetical protein